MTLKKLNFSTLIVFWFIWFWNHSFRAMIPMLLPVIQSYLLLSNTQVGLLVGSLLLGYSISGYPSARFSIKMGRKRVMATGITLSIVAMFFFSISHSFESMFITLFLVGLGLGSYLPLAISLISETFPANKRGTIIGMHETGAPSGQMIGPIFVGVSLATLGWEKCVQFWLILGLVCLFLIAHFKEKRQKDVIAHLPPLKTRESQKWSFSQYLLVLMTHLGVVSHNAVYSMIPLYLVEFFFLDAAFVATVLGVARAPGIFSQLTFGRLSDTFGRRKVLLFILLMFAITTVGVAFLPYGILFLITLLTYVATTQAYFPVFLAMVSDYTTPQERATKLGTLLSVGAFIGSGLTPIIIGYLSDNYGFSLAFTYPVALSLIALICLITLEISMLKKLLPS